MGKDKKKKLQEQIKEEEVKSTEGTSSPVLDKTIKADLQESMQDIKPLSGERQEAEAASMRPANESTEVSETQAPTSAPEPAPAETAARVESTAAQETPAATANPAPETNTSAPTATSTETPAEPVTPVAASVPETQEQAPVAETTPASVATPVATTEQVTEPSPAAQTQTTAPETSTSVAEATQPAATTGAATTSTTGTNDTTGTSTDTTGDATGAADTTGDGTSTTGTGSGEDTDEGAQEEDLDIYGETIKYLEEEAAKQKQQINDIYQNEIGGYDKLYGEAMKRKEALATMDKERSKKENAYRYISGVGDLMSGFANLVGTANYASNQDQMYLAPELVKKAEAARKERKLEMQKLNARLEEMRARKDALATQRDTKLAELDAKLVSDVFKANMQKAQDERMIKMQGMKDELEAAKTEGRLAVEREKNAGKIAVAEVKAANSLTNTRLRIRTSQGGRVKNATFYDENGQPKVLNVYSVEDVGAEVIKAVNANRASWSTEEQEEYKDAVTKATLAATYGGDGGEALEIFYEKMSQKPYVYEHMKRLVVGNRAGSNNGGTGQSGAAIYGTLDEL